jgi:cobalt-precorrin 5A hydrolase
MEKRAIAFTDKGREIIEKLNEEYQKKGMEGVAFYDKSFSVEEFVSRAFEDRACLIFVSAVGIAIRYISKYVNDKLKDTSVIVIDDNGQFVIPILAGHVGGANKVALTIAELLGAVPVITTSTDVNDVFSPDLYAVENNLRIENRDGIKKVSAKAVEGKAVRLSIKSFPPKEPVDVLVSDEKDADQEYSLLLSPKPYVLGVGTKKEKDVKEAEEYILSILEESGIKVDEVYALCSIDRKEEEECLVHFSRKYRIPFITFDAELLSKAEGEFSHSDYVQEKVGVGNVCERAAILGCRNKGELIVPKRTGEGITVAVAKRSCQ